MPTSCRIAATRSCASRASPQPSRRPMAAARSATACECGCAPAAVDRRSTAAASAAAQESSRRRAGTWTAERPCLTAYRRTSAWWWSSSRSRPSAGRAAAPIEAGARVGQRVADGAARPRCASRAPAPGTRTANSSPPSRPTVSPGRRAGQRRDDPAQVLVAGRVPVEVVELLEGVEVDQDVGEGLARALGAAQLDREALLEAAPVQAPGERDRSRARGPARRAGAAGCGPARRPSRRARRPGPPRRRRRRRSKAPPGLSARAR